ncbi:MAG: response regulator [Bacteroidota bacterium]
MTESPFVTLLVDDNEHDAAAMRRAWRRGEIDHPLYTVDDGQSCLDYLNQVSPYGDLVAAPMPSLILLDMQLPDLLGLDVLRIIRNDLRMYHIPVVLISGVARPEDFQEAALLGANAFLEKPSDYEAFSNMIWATVEFWRHNRFPHPALLGRASRAA